jgi:hypothetical protein
MMSVDGRGRYSENYDNCVALCAMPLHTNVMIAAAVRHTELIPGEDPAICAIEPLQAVFRAERLPRIEGFMIDRCANSAANRPDGCQCD